MAFARRNFGLLLLALGSQSVTACCSHDCGQQSEDISPPRLPPGFGVSVAIHENIVAVGDSVGRGFVFQRTASTWQGQATASVRRSTSNPVVQELVDAAAGAGTGIFAVSGTVAPMRFSGNRWAQLPAINATYIYRGAIAVSPSGNSLAIGGVIQDGSGRTESIDIFELENNAYVKKQSLELPAPRGAKSSLAMSEDVLIVASDGGLVQWYERSSTGFGPEPLRVEDLALGEDVCLSSDINETGDIVVIGRALCKNAKPTGVGQLFTIERGGDGVAKSASLLASDLPLLINSFVPVAISGTTIVAAINVQGSFSTVAVYERATDGWPTESSQKLMPRTSSLVTDVDISGPTLVVGSYSSDNGAGRVYVFEKGTTGFPSGETAILRSFEAQGSRYWGVSSSCR